MGYGANNLSYEGQGIVVPRIMMIVMKRRSKLPIYLSNKVDTLASEQSQNFLILRPNVVSFAPFRVWRTVQVALQHISQIILYLVCMKF